MRLWPIGAALLVGLLFGLEHWLCRRQRRRQLEQRELEQRMKGG